MKLKHLHTVWFSATGTTKLITGLIAEQFTADSTSQHDITKSTLTTDIHTRSTDLLLVGMPVYAGRIPATAIDALSKFKGDKTPAVIVCAYGNRAYEDALLELKELLQANGFVVIAAGAFVAQHAIFPTVAKARPDQEDRRVVVEFAQKSAELLAGLENTDNLPDLPVKGNRPYRKTKKVPLTPKVSSACTACGACVKLCPSDAIPVSNPHITLGRKCIACARCIAVCPQHARRFKGLLYRFAQNRFIKANQLRREAEVTLIGH